MLTTSIAASVSVATIRMAATAPSAAVRSSRCADARARNSLGVPAPTRRRMTVTVVRGAPCGSADEDEDEGPRRHDRALLLCVLIVLRPVRATTASAYPSGQGR